MDDRTPERRSANMGRIRSKDTAPELAVRKALWKAGIRYRKNWKGLPGKPDVAITKWKIAVFVDGEYFHGKDWEAGQRERVRNGSHSDYWEPKIERNRRRDVEVESELRGLGWTVMRFWSRDAKKDPEACVKAVMEAIERIKYEAEGFE